MHILFAIILISLLAACSHPRAVDIRPAPQPEAHTYVYHCENDYSFVARTDKAAVWLFLPDVTIQLRQVPSVTGVRYSDGGNTFWRKGEDAWLNHQGKAYGNCVNDRRAAVWEHAKLNGADFRAVGNEPGWHMEIRNKDRITLVSDYGQSEYVFGKASIESSAAERKTVYKAANKTHSIEVTLIGETCQDTMADEQFETRVTVKMDGRELKGCGRPLH